MENQKVCECHHCPEAVPSVGCTNHIWKDVEKLRPVIPINENRFSHETSAQEARKSETSAQPQHQPPVQKTIIEFQEYTGTLEESRNTFIHFEKSQETLGRCMAEMIDEIRKGRNGEQS